MESLLGQTFISACKALCFSKSSGVGSLKFNHWEIVPDELSEEFIIKTRKRKGI